MDDHEHPSNLNDSVKYSFSPLSIVCKDKSWVTLCMRVNITANGEAFTTIHGAAALEIWYGFPYSILTFFIAENLKNTYKK